MSTFGSPAAPGGNNKSSTIDDNDCTIPNAGDDGISSMAWSPIQGQNFLVSGNWDGGIRCWEVRATGQTSGPAVAAQAMAKVTHSNNAPVLDVCYSADGTTVYSCGADKAVRQWKLGETPPNGVSTQIGAHDSVIKSVGFLPASNLVVSGGWDGLLKFWDTRRSVLRQYSAVRFAQHSTLALVLCSF